MLFIDFEILRAEHPALALEWSALRRWIEKHPAVNVLEPGVLARELREEAGRINPIRLNEALRVLIDHANFVQEYRVIDPHRRTFAPGAWKTPLEIPAEIKGRTNETINTDEADIVPVLRPGF